MKLIIAAIFITVIATACSTTSHFVTPNEVRNIASTVFFNNGMELQGQLFITSNLWGKESVKLKKAGNDEIVQLKLAELKGYKVNNDYFDLKEIPTGIGKGFDYSFMKRLTPHSNKLRLYEHTKRNVLPDKTRQFTPISKELYVQFPEDKANVVWHLNSRKVNLYLNRKMGVSTQDCCSNAAPDYYIDKPANFSNEAKTRLLFELSAQDDTK